MTLDSTIAGLVAIVLLAYLLYTLVRPEDF